MKNLSLSAKVWAVLVLALTGSVVISAMGFVFVNNVADTSETLATVTAEKRFLASQMHVATNEIRVLEKVIILEESQEGMKSVSVRIDAAEAELRDLIARNKAIGSPADLADLNTLEQGLRSWKPVTEHLRNLAYQGENQEAAQVARGESVQKMYALQDVLRKMEKRDAEEMQTELESSLELASFAKLFMVIVTVGVVLLSTVLAFFMLRTLDKGMRRALANLSTASSETLNASQQVSTSSSALASGASEQAASLEETSSTLEQIGASTEQNASNAGQAENLANTALRNTHTGSEAMERMEGTITEIKDAADKTARIIKTIDEIAFQTNLLALNAAVEAARAGDAGRGFAVVAEEVRNLAMRSASAAKDTAELIEDSQTKAEQGVQVSSDVSSQLVQIKDNVQELTTYMGQVAAASREQSQGISQINSALMQMDEVTQSSAASAEETAASSEQLAAQAEMLSAVVRELSLLALGASKQSAKPATASKRRTNAPRATRHLSAPAPQRNQRALPEGTVNSDWGEDGFRKLPAPSDGWRNDKPSPHH